MKKSEFKELIKEIVMDLIENDDEVQDIVLECIKNNPDIISEQKAVSVSKEPADPELYDRLMLIASGQQNKLTYKGKTLKTPNYGAGFKSGKNIKEWANKAYSKIGGEWMESKRGPNPANLAALASMFGGEDNGLGSKILSVAQTGNQNALRETIKSNVDTNMNTTLLNEVPGFEGFQSGGDITDILVDTAQRTLPNFPSSHGGSGGGGGGVAIGAGAESFTGTPEQAFGSKAVSDWSTLAFFDEK